MYKQFTNVPEANFTALYLQITWNITIAQTESVISELKLPSNGRESVKFKLTIT